MLVSTFKLNGVEIKTPQVLNVQRVIERQRVILLNGQPMERIKRVYRVATLSYSMIEDLELQKLVQETIEKSLLTNSTVVEIEFMGLSGTMESMRAIFSDISASAVAESVLTGRWSELSDLVFEEVS